MNDIELHYIEKGSGQPLIFLHGNDENMMYYTKDGNTYILGDPQMITHKFGIVSYKVEEINTRVAKHTPPNASAEERERFKAFLERALGKGERKRRWKMLFSNEVGGAGKLHYSSEEYDPKNNVWRFNSYNIVHGNAWTGGTHVILFPHTEATVEDIPRLPFEFQHFGRHYGYIARRLRTTLLRHSDEKKYEFSEKGKKAVEEYMKEHGWKFVLAGTADYDDGQQATVLEIHKGDIVVERYWIDENRGYICPLIQCFSDNGELELERKAGQFFLHEDSGLWYPEIFEEKRDAQVSLFGNTTRKFVLNKSTFKLNQPVSDREFAIDIPEKMSVYDSRQGKGRSLKYIAMEPGTLSLARGGLDLDKMDWLMREGDLSYKKPSAAARRIRIAMMVLGMAFIVTALVMKYRQRNVPQ